MYYIFRQIGSGSFTQLTGGKHIGNGTGDPYHMINIKYFDAPNTTSNITYRIYARGNQSGNSMAVNNLGHYSTGAPNGPGMILAVTEYDGTKLTIAT